MVEQGEVVEEEDSEEKEGMMKMEAREAQEEE